MEDFDSPDWVMSLTKPSTMAGSWTKLIGQVVHIPILRHGVVEGLVRSAPVLSKGLKIGEGRFPKADLGCCDQKWKGSQAVK